MMPRQFLAPVALVLALALGGCGGGGGSSTPGSTGPIATLSPASLSFPMQLLATTSAARTVSLQNTGNATLTLPASAITLTGADAADYAATTDCGTSLAAGASCSINVKFTPGAGGTRTATLNVASNAPGSPATAASTGAAAGDNALPVTIDLGPTPQSTPTANIIYASVKFCTPGSTTACAVVDHIQVDTGSYGLRVFKSALTAIGGSSVVPQLAQAAGTSDPLFECVQYADGYTWGSVAVVDVQIGTRWLTNLRIQLTGDTNATGGVPGDCSSYAGKQLKNENQVSSFGANGILGIGNFLQDCGFYCAQTNPALYPQSGNYYQCPAAASCTAVPVALGLQVQNPISQMATDNNGALVSLPAISGKGAATASGFVFFGINTQPDNTVGAAKWFGLDSSGYLSTAFGSTTFPQSIVDSGSNAYFFDSTLTTCTNANYSWAYCPSASTGESAVISGATNSATATINFTVDSADTLFTTYGNDAVYPNLAGPASGVGSVFSNTFDWGLPFFLGRPVYVLFEAQPGPSGSGVTGPALAF